MLNAIFSAAPDALFSAVSSFLAEVVARRSRLANETPGNQSDVKSDQAIALLAKRVCELPEGQEMAVYQCLMQEHSAATGERRVALDRVVHQLVDNIHAKAGEAEKLSRTLRAFRAAGLAQVRPTDRPPLPTSPSIKEIQEHKVDQDIDVFLQAYVAVARALPEEQRTAAYKALGRKDPKGMGLIHRKLLYGLHPDKRSAGKQAASWVPSFDYDELRAAYLNGRDGYGLIASHALLLTCNKVPSSVLDASEQGIPTKFFYDPDLKYDSSMGDIFYNPENDVYWKQGERNVPGDLRRSQFTAAGADVYSAPGMIQAHFLQYRIQNRWVRKPFIELCLKATQQELAELDEVREHAEECLTDETISDTRALIEACRARHKREYLKSLGLWGGIDDEKVKQRVDDFLNSASVEDVYTLARFIIPACIEHQALPTVAIIERAREAQRKHDAGSVGEGRSRSSSSSGHVEATAATEHGTWKQDVLFSGIENEALGGTRAFVAGEIDLSVSDDQDESASRGPRSETD